ncbi:MAG: hypothetical protein EAS51_07100 [Microbacteriaceae bacterium]|nr:MAG: hypothetical protein EAS51_07100 [Microbacteriaceae bacterium]
MAAYDRQRDAHRAESDEQHQAVTAADARAAAVRAEVAAPLIEQATADGTAHIETRGLMWEATAARSAAGRLRKRAADRAATQATGEHHATEDAVRRRWGSLPTGAGGVEPWAETVARRQAHTDQRVTETRLEAEQAHREQSRLAERHLRESTALRRQLLGSATPSTAATCATGRRARAEQARHDLAQIEALPVTEAAQLVRELAARAEAERQTAERAQAAREARAAQLGPSRPSSEHGRTGSERDFGPSL